LVFADCTFIAMRKLLIIFLLAVYCITQTGVLAWYYGKSLIHSVSSNWQNIKTTIDNNSGLSHIKLDIATYRAKVKDGEISLNGTLYDIAKTSVSGKTIYLTLEKDEVETYLLKQYNQLTNWLKKHHPSKQSEQYVLNWMMKLYFSCSYNISSNHLVQINLHIFATGNKYLPSPYFENPPQPPEQSFSFA
jgi:hypothetical protein